MGLVGGKGGFSRVREGFFWWGGGRRGGECGKMGEIKQDIKDQKESGIKLTCRMSCRNICTPGCHSMCFDPHTHSDFPRLR
jgi:hypothetical protein